MRRKLVALGRALLLLLASAAVGVAVNALRPHGVRLLMAVRSQAEEGMSACSMAGHAAPAGSAAVVPIDCREAATLLGRPGIEFVDVRPAPTCLAGHVSGACRLDGDPAVAAHGAEVVALARARTVILYGSASEGTACEPVRQAARALRSQGCDDVRVLEGGFEAWVANGEPAASGACASCGAPAGVPSDASTAPGAMSSMSAGRGS